MTGTDHRTAIARDYAREIVSEALAFRTRCSLQPVLDVEHTALGDRIVLAKRPSEQWGLTLSVYADPNDVGSVAVDLADDAGEVLQSIRLRTVALTVASATVVTLINFAQTYVA
jgi:hypothetical protein